MTPATPDPAAAAHAAEAVHRAIKVLAPRVVDPPWDAASHVKGFFEACDAAADLAAAAVERVAAERDAAQARADLMQSTATVLTNLVEQADAAAARIARAVGFDGDWQTVGEATADLGELAAAVERWAAPGAARDGDDESDDDPTASEHGGEWD